VENRKIEKGFLPSTAHNLIGRKALLTDSMENVTVLLPLARRQVPTFSEAEGQHEIDDCHSGN
jgi:hypothetical protein